jgi:hypothetical protein
MKWLFSDPPNVAVYTTEDVATGQDWIAYVTHDEDDGAWQFIGHREATEEEARIVALKTIVTLDKSVAELHDLPLGWVASRSSPQDEWTRRPSD